MISLNFSRPGLGVEAKNTDHSLDKLHLFVTPLGILDSKPLLLPMRHALNATLVGISTAGLGAFLATGGCLDNPMLPLSVLLGGAALAGSVSGVTLTAAIGG